jgi:hypothetical protein
MSEEPVRRTLILQPLCTMASIFQDAVLAVDVLSTLPVEREWTDPFEEGSRSASAAGKEDLLQVPHEYIHLGSWPGRPRA